VIALVLASQRLLHLPDFAINTTSTLISPDLDWRKRDTSSKGLLTRNGPFCGVEAPSPELTSTASAAAGAKAHGDTGISKRFHRRSVNSSREDGCFPSDEDVGKLTTSSRRAP